MKNSKYSWPSPVSEKYLKRLRLDAKRRKLFDGPICKKYKELLKKPNFK